MFDRDETELIGQDGHIYKGRFEGLDRMPDLPPVRGFQLKFCFYLYLVSLSLSHFLFVLHFPIFFLFRSLAYFSVSIEKYSTEVD